MMSLYLLDLSFINLTVWDALDVLIVGFLIYQLYHLLRGTVALYILVGVILLYLVWFLVRALHMDMLSAILSQFVSVGVLLIAIIFQPELRRFLLLLGETAVKNRQFTFLKQWLPNIQSGHLVGNRTGDHLVRAFHHMKQREEGAIIVLTQEELPSTSYHSGVELNANLSTELIETVFKKNSPLHDGGMIIQHAKIIAARCILPLTMKQDIPGDLGLRHRAAIGISESVPVLVLVLSEETGELSIAQDGKLRRDYPLGDLKEYIDQWSKSAKS